MSEQFTDTGKLEELVRDVIQSGGYQISRQRYHLVDERPGFLGKPPLHDYPNGIVYSLKVRRGSEDLGGIYYHLDNFTKSDTTDPSVPDAIVKAMQEALHGPKGHSYAKMLELTTASKKG